MSSILLLLISIVVFIVAYATYGSYLAKSWGIDPKRKTPAFELEDGIDYVPANKAVLLGHHFSSIAGAGPINGPIQAAVFGWIPVFLWIVIGGIFFGAVQDFSALFASIRHKGKSLGEIIEVNISHRTKICFTVFAWLVLILVVAAFADIVAGTFAGYNAEGQTVATNGSVATASTLFIPLAIAFGLFNRKSPNLVVNTIVGVALLIACIGIGIACPLYFSKLTWLVIVFVYIFIASVAPVWILLQPRDYLNSFLLYFMIAASAIGIIFTNPTMQLTGFTGWTAPIGTLFPFLFVTVACGAISGFHSLISSGTTSKQISNEADAKAIGYGSMLVECILAVIALIAVGSASMDTWTGMTPPQIFAGGIASMLAKIGFPEHTASTILMLAISAFALTSLDTATRLGRFLFQELFATRKDGTQNILSNMYVATAVTIGAAALLTIAGYTKIWALFGACNQLVAVPAFLAAACWLKRIGKKYSMLYIPMFFMLITSGSALVLKFISNAKLLMAGEGVAIVEGLQCVLIVPILVLTVILAIDGFKVLFGKKTETAAEAA
ncbi:MAG: carbon starvation protein A [Eubacteriaceae bacterium]|nr:carbon starvation protein A [Eubacteriaceae bacterium]